MLFFSFYLQFANGWLPVNGFFDQYYLPVFHLTLGNCFMATALDLHLSGRD